MTGNFRDPPDATTPQFRTLLLRRLKNLFPTLNADIRPLPNGVSFQLFDADGKARSKRVSIYRHHREPLEATFLRRLVGEAGERGFPE